MADEGNNTAAVETTTQAVETPTEANLDGPAGRTGSCGGSSYS